MKSMRVDLHIHTCLSPCAELDMTPSRIIGRAVEQGLDMIAISDHNSALNAGVAMQLGRDAGLSVMPALEVTTQEEAHVLAVFGGLAEALSMQELVYSDLPASGGERFGMQVMVSATEEVLGFEQKVLLGATGMTLIEVVNEIRFRGGLAIASHVDRGAFSVMSQMGFVPGDVIFDAFEVLDRQRARRGVMLHPDVPWMSHSDAHRIEDVGRRFTELRAKAPEFQELALALRGQGGRHVSMPQ